MFHQIMWVPYRFDGSHMYFNQSNRVCWKMCVRRCVGSISHKLIHSIMFYYLLTFWLPSNLGGIDGTTNYFICLMIKLQIQPHPHYISSSPNPTIMLFFDSSIYLKCGYFFTFTMNTNNSTKNKIKQWCTLIKKIIFILLPL